MKRYRILYNQDCTNLFAVTREPVTPAHVDRMVDEVADGGADVMLINPNAQRVNYPSRAWQTFWDGYEPGKAEFYGPIPEKDRALRERWVVQMKQLADSGCDYLARALARCREKGIAPGVSIRMNDMHDAPMPGTHLFSRFYMEHPECWLDNGPACGWGARGLNFERPEVHEHFLTLVRELVADYDFDVLELDFLRFHCYFPRNDFARHAAIMTAFVGQVREELRKSKRSISLLARVPATPASAYELGFDVKAWAEAGLVDGISASAFLVTPWGADMEGYRRLVGDRVAVYACGEYAVDRRPGLPVRGLPVEPDLLCGFAAGHLAAGADGLEFFNFFCARETAWEKEPKEPAFHLLGEVKSADRLRGQRKVYTTTSGWVLAETDGPIQVPAVLEKGCPRAFPFNAAAEPAIAAVQVDLLFGGGPVQASAIWVQVNDIPAGNGKESIPVEGADGLCRVVVSVSASALRDGGNRMTVRNEGATATLVSWDIRVR